MFAIAFLPAIFQKFGSGEMYDSLLNSLYFYKRTRKENRKKTTKKIFFFRKDICHIMT